MKTLIGIALAAFVLFSGTSIADAGRWTTNWACPGEISDAKWREWGEWACPITRKRSVVWQERVKRDAGALGRMSPKRRAEIRTWLNWRGDN